jgi:hypothetical protein
MANTPLSVIDSESIVEPFEYDQIMAIVIACCNYSQSTKQPLPKLENALAEA